MGKLKNSVKHSIARKIFFTYFFVGMVMMSVGLGISYFISVQNTRNLFSDFVNSESQGKAREIDNLFWERKGDIYLISKSNIVREFISDDLNVVLARAKDDVKSNAVRVGEEVENYLKDNPEKTASDLQNDSRFRSIAVQNVGLTGYTAIADYDSLVVLVHESPVFENVNLESLSGSLPGFWKIAERARGGLVSSGFYEWREQSGEYKQKYMYVYPVRVKTADGVGLAVASTTYVDEYGAGLEFASRAEEYFRSLISSYNASNLYIITSEGDVIWNVDSSREYGTNLIDGPYSEGQLSSSFIRVLNTRETQVSDLDLRSEESSGVYFLAPIFDDQYSQILGVVVVEVSINRVDNILAGGELKNVREDLNYYVVGEDGLIRSTSRKEGNYEVYRKKVSNDQIKQCFYLDNDVVSDRFLSYVGDDGVRVYGSHQHLSEVSWCLISEFPRTTIFSQAKLTLPYYVASAVLYLLAILYISRRFGLMISDPVKKIQVGLRKFIDGDLRSRITINSEDEFSELAKDFNTMADKMASSYSELEVLVKKRTENLQKALNLMVGRELRMAELKKMISSIRGGDKDIKKNDDSISGEEL